MNSTEWNVSNESRAWLLKSLKIYNVNIWKVRLPLWWKPKQKPLKLFTFYCIVYYNIQSSLLLYSHRCTEWKWPCYGRPPPVHSSETNCMCLIHHPVQWPAVPSIPLVIADLLEITNKCLLPMRPLRRHCRVRWELEGFTCYSGCSQSQVTPKPLELFNEIRGAFTLTDDLCIPSVYIFLMNRVMII